MTSHHKIIKLRGTISTELLNLTAWTHKKCFTRYVKVIKIKLNEKKILNDNVFQSNQINIVTQIGPPAPEIVPH